MELSENAIGRRFRVKTFPQPDIIALKHPVLLCHGYGAYASLRKPTQLHDVCMYLRAHGIKAVAPNGAPFASIQTRAENWVNLFHEVREQLGVDKLNVISHSMGGLDMRYAISQLDLAPYVSSLTTIATPHHGTWLAELGLSTPELIRERLKDFLNWVGNNMYPRVESDIFAAVSQLTRPYLLETFNPLVKNAENVEYYSYSAACHHTKLLEGNPTLLVQTRFMNKQEGPNDGIVSAKSAVWGTHLGCLELNHLEQIHLSIDKKRIPLWEKTWTDIAKKLAQLGH
jgi:triacylglycerol lipase